MRAAARVSGSKKDFSCHAHGDYKTQRVADGRASGKHGKCLRQFAKTPDEFPILVIHSVEDGYGHREQVFAEIGYQSETGRGDKKLNDAAARDESGTDKGGIGSSRERGGNQHRSEEHT